MNAWWWLSVPYSVILPLFVLVFRLKDSIPHTLGLFIYLAFLTTFSSAVWMLKTIYQLTVSGNMSLTWRTKVKLGLFYSRRSYGSSRSQGRGEWTAATGGCWGRRESR